MSYELLTYSNMRSRTSLLNAAMGESRLCSIWASTRGATILALIDAENFQATKFQILGMN